MWKVPGGTYTMPGGLVKLYLEEGATPWSWPSLGRPLEAFFPILPQPVATTSAISTDKADRFFIFIILKGIGQKYCFTDFITSLEFIFKVAIQGISFELN